MAQDADIAELGPIDCMVVESKAVAQGVNRRTDRRDRRR